MMEALIDLNEVLEKLRNKHKNIFIINQDTNKGQSFSIYNGVHFLIINQL